MRPSRNNPPLTSSSPVSALANNVGTDESGGADDCADDREYAAFLDFLGLEEYDGSEEDDERVHLQPQSSSHHRIWSEYPESRRSQQENQIESLKTEVAELRRRGIASQRERDFAVEQLREENEIIKAQKSALEDILVEINNSARESISPSHPHRVAGSADLVMKVVMLETENEVLKSSADLLRERAASLKEEKRCIEEEMNALLTSRDATIANLENRLRAMQQATRLRFSKKKGGSKRLASSSAVAAASDRNSAGDCSPHSPDKAAGGH